MNILKVLKPENKEVDLDGEIWSFPYRVFYLVELESSIIVSFSWSDIKKKLPHEGFYHGCTVWCYNKKDKSIKWIIEEPPLAYAEGKIWNRGPSPVDPSINRDECYMDISYSKYDDALSSDTTGARRFRVDPDNGKVTLIVSGVR